MTLTAQELKSLKNSQWKRNNERESKRLKEENKQLRISHAQSTRKLNKITAQICADAKAMEFNGITLEVLIAYRDKMNQSKVA